MAIQKVSDLSVLETENLGKTDSDAFNRFRASLVEISYPEETEIEYSRYKSMATTVDTLSTCIIADIISGDVFYYGDNHYLQPVYMHGGGAISGNLCVNYDLPDEMVSENNYFSYIKTTYNRLIAIDGTDSDSGINILSAQTANYFYSNDTEIFDYDGNLIAAFYPISVQINQDLYSLCTFYSNEISCADGKFIDLSCQNPIKGCALSAVWADLAEYYAADEDYDPGTLVAFGGDQEITKAVGYANAVVTTRPGLMLNADISAEHPVGIALTGRTPVLVSGKVCKFDDLFLNPEMPGTAKANFPTGYLVGIALENKETEELGLIEAVVKMTI